MSASIVLHPDREKSLHRQHPWIFASAVAELKGRSRPGDTVEVLSHDGKWLARAAYSPESQIRARVWTFKQDENIDNPFFIRRLQDALRLRRRMISEQSSNAFRWIASESDGLPGVTIDVYANVVVVQLLSAGADKQRDKIVWAIKKLMPHVCIYERSDVEVRQKEGLPLLTQSLAGEVPDEVRILEHGVEIIVDVKGGHKTGFYLDQRDNRRRLGELAKDAEVLNCFSYTGTFALHALKGGARHVTNVDVSAPAIALSTQHVRDNQLDEQRIEHVQGDVFTVLRDYHQQQRQFDIVVLDPPKFVDSKASLPRASRGYKDINLYGIHAVRPGGLLFTFSCSGLMPAELFQKIVADAALDAGRTLKIVQRLEQAADHPVLSTFPEGYYLKGLVCELGH